MKFRPAKPANDNGLAVGSGSASKDKRVVSGTTKALRSETRNKLDPFIHIACPVCGRGYKISRHATQMHCEPCGNVCTHFAKKK